MISQIDGAQLPILTKCPLAMKHLVPGVFFVSSLHPMFPVKAMDKTSWGNN